MMVMMRAPMMVMMNVFDAWSEEGSEVEPPPEDPPPPPPEGGSMVVDEDLVEVEKY